MDGSCGAGLLRSLGSRVMSTAKPYDVEYCCIKNDINFEKIIFRIFFRLNKYQDSLASCSRLSKLPNPLFLGQYTSTDPLPQQTRGLKN